MYIKIKNANEGKGIKLNKLSRNADDLLIVLENNNAMTFNFADFYEKLQANESPMYVIDETFRDFQSDFNDNPIINLTKFVNYLKEKHGLTDSDFEIMSDLTWHDNGLNLPVRVTIPQGVVFSNMNYIGLVSHVKGLMELNRAYYYVKNGLVYLYFVALLQEHEALLAADSNVMIEK
ncbi:hypothetical protein [Massilibacteroides sp.]|uniref:hypothetical protein n=1 Tax=Massilibacteroides sp. TaxID=2034766 RepID=UPI00260AD201|nr:hypothetical protein [Massilibacteroides sp.]MDD4515631.1 hypothetical protein [Massilibacteroides sp.]